MISYVCSSFSVLLLSLFSDQVAECNSLRVPKIRSIFGVVGMLKLLAGYYYKICLCGFSSSSFDMKQKEILVNFQDHTWWWWQRANLLARFWDMLFSELIPSRFFLVIIHLKTRLKNRWDLLRLPSCILYIYMSSKQQWESFVLHSAEKGGDRLL